MAESREWDGEIVRRWLEARIRASQDDQTMADRAGRDREDEYDKAAAEEYVCQLIRTSDTTDSQASFTARLKQIAAKDEHYRTGLRSEKRFEREVRAYLRKLLRMATTYTGFENTSRYQ
jgi:hypothetical protein